MKQVFLKSVALLMILFIGSTYNAVAQTSVVTGTVTDETGAPMVGLTVIVTGTTSGATTNLDGVYEINVPANATLTFSYLGYETQVVEVGGRTKIDVKLLPDAQLLSDAVVIGYGTTAKKDLTGDRKSVV